MSDNQRSGSDERCARKYSGDFQRAIVIDGDRADRLLLAALLDDSDIRELVIEEIGDCADCFRGVAICLAAQAATLYATDDDRDEAVELIKSRLVKSVATQMNSEN